jgi:hypothetical protein
MAKVTNIIKQFNNGTLIASVPKSRVKDLGFTDVSLLRDTFKENREHLGTLKLFEQLGIVNVPLMKELTAKKQYMYVDGINGSFTWDIMLDATFPEVVMDVEEGEYLGIDGDSFKMKLSYPFRPNDILTYDPIDGVQVMVIGEEVVNEGDGHVHEVRLVSDNREAYFPKSKLVAGTRFGKVDNILGEYDKQFSGIDTAISNSKATLEFRLGGVRGVEVAWTTFAKSVTLGTGEHGSQHKDTMNALEAQINRWGANAGDLLAYGVPDGKGGMKVSKIDGILETLAMAELYKMTAMGVMFNQGATITGGISSKKINEGIYPMMRRGHRFTYTHSGELKAMIQQAADVVFQGLPIRMEDRKLTFKGGYEVVQKVRDLFKVEFSNTLPVPLESYSLPKALITGSDLNNLTYKTFAIETCFINGIGNVTIDHDPSFDYDFGDFASRGFVGIGGRSKRTWSLAIWDAANSSYSNANDASVMPKGVTMEKDALGGNIYLVKPKGLPDMNTSRRIGRIEGSNNAAVLDYMGEEFAVWNSLASWIKDLSRVVLIEKADSMDYSL